MSEEPAANPSSSGTVWITVCVLTLIAYLLSPGLVYASMLRWQWVSPEAMGKPFSVFYSPIILACKWEPVGKCYSALSHVVCRTTSQCPLAAT